MIRLNLEDGMENLIKQIEKAGKDAEAAAERCMRESAEIMHEKLVDEMVGHDSGNGAIYELAQRMPAPEIEKDFGKVTAHVGYHKGTYNPNELSDGYKVVFLNYGTPRRPDKQGQIQKMGFIDKAKKRAKPLIREKQEKTLKEILENVK